MKSFTPDLINRFGSEDDRVALAAQHEFEGGSEGYLRHLHEIEDKLPQRFRELLEQFYLHDSRVISHSSLGISEPGWLRETKLAGFVPGWKPASQEESGARSFWIVLQLDTPPRETLVLQYRSAVIEETHLHQSLREEDCPDLEWLYDEVELIRTDRGNEFRHSILFTKGLELRLRFGDFDFTSTKPIETMPEFAEASPGTAAANRG
jgi:hypothetical protein